MPFFKLFSTLTPDSVTPDQTGVVLWASNVETVESFVRIFKVTYASRADNGKLEWNLQALIQDLPGPFLEFAAESPHLARDLAALNEYNLPIWKFFVEYLGLQEYPVQCEVLDPTRTAELRIVMSHE